MAVTRRGSEDDIQLNFMLYIKRLIPSNLFLFINIIVYMCHMILFLHQREQTALSCDNHLWCILYYYIISRGMFKGWGERHLWESNGIWMCCECCFKWSTSCKPIVKFSGILYSLFYLCINILYLWPLEHLFTSCTIIYYRPVAKV